VRDFIPKYDWNLKVHHKSRLAFAPRSDLIALQQQIKELQRANRTILTHLTSHKDASNSSLVDLLNDSNDQAPAVTLNRRCLTPIPTVARSWPDDGMSDTEDAALVLEEFAIGRARMPAVVAIGHCTDSRTEITSRYHSILRQPQSCYDEPTGYTPAMPPSISNHGQRIVSEILPDLDLSPKTTSYLLDLYFKHVSWHWNVHHEPTFRKQFELFQEIQAANRLDLLDPMFLCSVFLASIINHLHSFGVPDHFFLKKGYVVRCKPCCRYHNNCPSISYARRASQGIATKVFCSKYQSLSIVSVIK